MRLWTALAVQILAIVLREHSRDKIHPGPEIPPVCSCYCDTVKEPEAEPTTDFRVSYLLAAASFTAGALTIGLASWALGPSSHGAVGPGKGRRRGGGVLSEAD